MSWLYVPGLEALNSDSNSHLIFSENAVASSLQWRGKPQQLEAWSRRWKQGGFIRLLSGLTCEPLTAQRGADAWISSLRATRARATALPGSGLASLTIAGCSIAPSKSLMPAGLVISSARTCRGTRADSSPLPSQHWSDWAAALRAEYSARPKPATPCGASDCSSWPSEEWMAPVADDTGTRNKRYAQGGMALSMQVTQWVAPQARDHFPAHSPERIAAMKALGHGMRNLNDEAEHWEAPSVAVTAGTRLTRSGDRSDELLLTGQALETSRWAAPCAQNHKGSSEGSITRQDGKSRMDLLHYQAEQAFDPGHFPSSPAPATAAGSTCSTASPNTNQPSAKRKLNPIFVEALMRWPTGLSGFERQETAWTRWWLLMPSCVSELVSDCGPTEQMDLFGEAA